MACSRSLHLGSLYKARCGRGGLRAMPALRFGMEETNPRVICPTCHTVIPVEPGWRLVQCPKCGGMITRMGEDSSYD